MTRTLRARGLGATSAPRLVATNSDVWAVPTVEAARYLRETAAHLADLVRPTYQALTTGRPGLPPIDQIDVAIMGLGTALDGVRRWRHAGTPLPSPLPEHERRLLWTAHDAACKLIHQLRHVALAARRSEEAPWLEHGKDSLEEAMGALVALGLLEVVT